MSLATRCPICQALFRVTPDQLRVRGGQVRCGHCSAVFDGLRHLDAETGRPADDSAGRSGVAFIDRSGVAARASPGSSEPAAPAAHLEAQHDVRSALAPTPRLVWLRHEWKAIALSVGLAVLLAMQVGLRQRDVLAAQYPALRGILSALCGIVGCEVGLPRAADRLSIEGDEMIAVDPGNPGRVFLAATLRNSAPFPVAYPSLELALQNAQNEILARRVFDPADYLPAGSDVKRGLAPHDEFNVGLALDTGLARAEGYRLFLFYPE